MKRLKIVISLALMLMVGGSLWAQSHSNGALYLGASFPIKDFARFDALDNLALFDADSKECGASIGFNAGLKWYFNMGIPGASGLGVLFSIDGFYNGPNAQLEEAYRSNEGQNGSQFLGGSFAYKSTPKYINAPVMIGLNYIYDLTSSLSVYAEAGGGANVRYITPLKTMGTVMLLGFENKEVSTQHYDIGFSFAWQAGIGIEVGRKFRVGCSFYDFGKTNLRGEEVVTTTVGNNTSNNSYLNTFGTMRPLMILGRIGFSF